MDQLLGVVLCGGESRRMGRDKGLLPAGDTIWALSAAGKLAPFGIHVIFSINEKQEESYSAYIPRDQLVIDIVEEGRGRAGLADVRGPLKGLLSVHRRFPGSSLLLLACDMPHLDETTIQKMITTCHEENQYDFYVYQDLEFAQPFCGIYTSQGLDKVDIMALPGERSAHDFSLQSLLNKANTRRLTIDRPEAFQNYNSL